MKRLPVLTAALLVAMVAGAGPAGAHEEISPSFVGTGRSAFLTFTAANERQVPLPASPWPPPAGLELGPVTREPEGWTAARAPTGVTWSGATLPPGKFEQWGVELEAPDLPGTFTFRSTLRFADGRADSHDVALTVTSGGVPGVSLPAPAMTSTPGPATTVAPGTAPPVSVAAGPNDGAPPAAGSGAASAASDDAASARRRANLAVGLGGGGLVAGLLAVVLAARRPRPTSAGAAPPEEQQW